MGQHGLMQPPSKNPPPIAVTDRRHASLGKPGSNDSRQAGKQSGEAAGNGNGARVHSVSAVKQDTLPASLASKDNVQVSIFL